MEQKEPSAQARILLAFALSFIVLFISSRLFVGPPPEPPPETPSGAVSDTPSPPVPTQDSPSEPQPQPAEAAVAPQPQISATQLVQGTTEEEIIIESDLYRAVFTTRGAALKSWQLTQYNDRAGNQLELVNPAAAEEYGDPLSIWVSDGTLRSEINSALFVPSSTGTLQAPVTLTLEYSDNRITARKEFVFTRDSYLVQLTSELSRDGQPMSHALAWLGALGNLEDFSFGGSSIQVFYRDPQEMVRLYPGNVERNGFGRRMLNGIQGMLGLLEPSADIQEVSILGSFPYAGIEDHFFCAAFLPQEGPLRVNAFEQDISLPEQTRRFSSLGVAVSSGDAPVNRLRLYLGPKDRDVLATVEPQLPLLVDFGWFSFIAQPLFLAMQWTHENIVGNYGWVIVLITILINFVLFPLKIKTMRSTMKMQRIQPQLKAIQDKYKQYKVNDPRRQEMTKETMALYKKHGVNPLGGCLPMLLQMPFLYGFYQVLIQSIEMRHAPWILWVQDLSSPEQLPIKTLPLLLCATQFLLQRMSPMPSPDPMQRKLMMYMPLMFLFLFWGLSSGLVLYWLTGNVVGIAQQWYINRTEMQHLIAEKRAVAARKKKARQKK